MDEKKEKREREEREESERLSGEEKPGWIESCRERIKPANFLHISLNAKGRGLVGPRKSCQSQALKYTYYYVKVLFNIFVLHDDDREMKEPFLNHVLLNTLRFPPNFPSPHHITISVSSSSSA